ncbi:methyl-accepting chemotaxis protein [Brevibacillus fulvus]|uniref:Methyl-accepting transducer domain-containing protein n=1 Tax=Brevibacillus fulvus TaxID=1125967 RepID=A0A939BVQ4_9BACL|nr:methyl-accepting chemotaxis protein [Brevibacillus fulvus]MBM7590941.1 hypothetical protein [Brevibacillus fulvus]
MIEHVLATMPTLSLMYPTATLALSDTEKILYYQEGDIKLGLVVGNEVNKQSITYKTMESGETIRQSVTREQSRFGIAFNVISVPIYGEAKKLEGALTLIFSREKEEKISLVSEELASSVTQMNQWAEHVASGAAQLASSITDISHNCRDVMQSVEENAKVVDVVKDMANRSNLLGLNAAIQAAQAGEYGRTFGVVASEIRNLAEQSRKSSESILKSMSSMKEKVVQVMREMEEESAATQEMASSIQQINAALQSLQEMAIEMKQLARFS